MLAGVEVERKALHLLQLLHLAVLAVVERERLAQIQLQQALLTLAEVAVEMEAAAMLVVQA
jgi:hypothetical protein